MKKFKMSLILLLLPLLIMAGLPEYNRASYITDLASILDDSAEHTLDKKIRNFEKTTSIEIVIVTVSSLDGLTVEDYGNQLFRKWGIGKKGQNNGLMILVAPTERKWRIEVGYGLEEWITDGGSAAVANRLLKPNFKQQKYFEGLDALLDTFIDQLGNSTWVQREADKKTQEKISSAKQEGINKFMLGFLAVLCASTIIGIILYFIIKSVKKSHRKEEERKAEVERVHGMYTVIITSQEKISSIETSISKLRTSKYVSGNVKTVLEQLESDKTKLLNYINTAAHENVEKPILTLMYDNTLSIIKLYENKLNRIESSHKICLEIEAYGPKLTSELAVIRRNAQLASDKLKTVNSEGSKFDGYKSKTINTDIPLQAASDLLSEAVAALTTNVDDAIMYHNKSKEQLELAISAINYANRYVQEFESAKSWVTSNFRQLDNLLSNAERACSYSDVSHYTKSSLSMARSTVSSIKSKLGKKDPITERNQIEEAMSSIKGITQKAKRDKSDAEDERRNLAVAAAAVIASSSSSSSSSSSDVSFGGGDSGGGGSSGNW